MSSASISGNQYTYITTAATNTIWQGSGVLVAIVINKALTGAVKIMDNTTGTTANIGTLAAASAAGTYTYNVAFGSGLMIINASTEDLTIVWRR